MNQRAEPQRTVIEGAADGPRLLVVAGVHGDEYEGMLAVRRLQTAIDANALRGRVTLVPVANVAAFERGERTAEDSLDLARTCPGREDGSITQRTAHALSELIKDSDYLIDLHSGGRALWLQPLSGFELHRDERVLEAQRRMARAFNLPIIWGTATSNQGTTLFVASRHNIPAIYAEWMGGGLCDRAGAEAYFEGCLNVMAKLGMIDRDAPPSVIKHVVDDRRDGSGHLQINYPSPAAGFFEAKARLGEPIDIGESLGTVSDELGNNVVDIVSTQRGMLLALRAFSRVKQGDCLGVVLELDHNDGKGAA